MNKLNIMIVEDESIIMLDLKKSLTKLGHDIVAQSKNYEQAIRMFIKNQNSIDVIFMDVNLGKNSKDGIQTAIEILNIKKVNIIYLTSYTSKDIVGKAIITNPMGYLQKPFDIDEIKTILKKIEK